MATEFTSPPEDDEVPELKKHRVDISLSSMLSVLAERPRAVAAAQQSSEQTVALSVSMHPDIAPRLTRISELAAELQAELDAINAIDPEILSRLKQGSQEAT